MFEQVWAHLNQSWSRHLLQIWGPIYHKIIQNNDQIQKKNIGRNPIGDCEQKGKKKELDELNESNRIEIEWIETRE